MPGPRGSGAATPPSCPCCSAPGVCKGSGTALLREPPGAGACSGLAACWQLGDGAGLLVPCRVQDGLGSSGRCWPWGRHLSREPVEKMLGFQREQELAALLLPVPWSKQQRRLFSSRPSNTQGARCEQKFRVPPGLRAPDVHQYRETRGGNVSKSPCFAGRDLKIGTQNMWFAV